MKIRNPFCQFVLCLSFATLCLLSISSEAQGMRTLEGHVPKATKHLKPIGRLPATKNLRLAISLPLRNQDQLTNFLRDLYDSDSPLYHHYLSPAEFTQQFGPTEQQYQSVIDFANAHGLKVVGTHPNRVLVDVSGPVSNIEQTFHVTLNVYQHPTEARTFFAPDTEPSVPANLPILDVSGLSDFQRPRPQVHIRKAPSGTNAPVHVGSGPNGAGYMGNDFRAAYVPGVTNTGAGQSIALVEFDGFYASDIQQYEMDAGISTNIPVTTILLNGFDGSQGDGNMEVALDIEVAVAMAPGISNVFVYEESFSSDPVIVNDLLNRIATDDNAKQISCSWVLFIDATSDQIFQEYAAQGQSFYDACGDSGAIVGSVIPAADDPYITQVGATTLTTTGPGGSYVSETVWNWYTTGEGQAGGSGGVSTTYSIPDWQQPVNMTFNMGSATMRNFPDVTMVGDEVFVVDNNGSQDTVGGTSCAAPLWAAFTALVNQQAVATGKATVGFINPAIYNIGLGSDYDLDFHDVTTGNNTNDLDGRSEFVAIAGYDLCSGFGSPTGSNLINALLAPADALQISLLPGFTSSGPAGGPFNITSQAYVLTNNGNAAINWTNGSTASWLSVSPPGGRLTSHASATVTVSLNAEANSLSPDIYSGEIWFTNLTSHFAQMRQFALQVGQPLVRNGGFETGDFSYWLLEGDPYPTNFVDDGSQTGITIEGGTWSATLGQVGLPLGTLTQMIPTFAGQPYLLSFYWQNPDLGGGTTPNEFSVSWNGSTIFHQTDLPTEDNWTNFQFLVAASGISTPLQFGARNDNAVFGLDDVSVTPFPQPSFTSVERTNDVVTLVWTAVPGYNYELQYNTNLLQTNWATFVGPIVANSSTMVSTDSNASNKMRFYRIVLLL